MDNSTSEWMVIGQIAGPFGVHGHVKVQPLTDHPERFQELHELFVGPEARAYRLESSRRHSDRLLLKLGGIDSPEQVHELRGQEIRIPRSQAIPLAEGEFYLEDALGIEAFDIEGKSLGSVIDVLRTGANEVFVVRGDDGDVLIPVTKDAVRRLDMEARTVVVEPWILKSPA